MQPGLQASSESNLFAGTDFLCTSPPNCQHGAHDFVTGNRKHVNAQPALKIISVLIMKCKYVFLFFHMFAFGPNHKVQICIFVASLYLLPHKQSSRCQSSSNNSILESSSFPCIYVLQLPNLSNNSILESISFPCIYVLWLQSLPPF